MRANALKLLIDCFNDESLTVTLRFRDRLHKLRRRSVELDRRHAWRFGCLLGNVCLAFPRRKLARLKLPRLKLPRLKLPRLNRLPPAPTD
jgi:hypothetical protein